MTGGSWGAWPGAQEDGCTDIQAAGFLPCAQRGLARLGSPLAASLAPRSGGAPPHAPCAHSSLRSFLRSFARWDPGVCAAHSLIRARLLRGVSTGVAALAAHSLSLHARSTALGHACPARWPQALARDSRVSDRRRCSQCRARRGQCWSRGASGVCRLPAEALRPRAHGACRSPRMLPRPPVPPFPRSEAESPKEGSRTQDVRLTQRVRVQEMRGPGRPGHPHISMPGRTLPVALGEKEIKTMAAPPPPRPGPRDLGAVDAGFLDGSVTSSAGTRGWRGRRFLPTRVLPEMDRPWGPQSRGGRPAPDTPPVSRGSGTPRKGTGACEPGVSREPEGRRNTRERRESKTETRSAFAG